MSSRGSGSENESDGNEASEDSSVHSSAAGSEESDATEEDLDLEKLDKEMRILLELSDHMTVVRDRLLGKFPNFVSSQPENKLETKPHEGSDLQQLRNVTASDHSAADKAPLRIDTKAQSPRNIETRLEATPIPPQATPSPLSSQREAKQPSLSLPSDPYLFQTEYGKLSNEQRTQLVNNAIRFLLDETSDV